MIDRDGQRSFDDWEVRELVPLLVELLRSERPIPRETRDQLADLFDDRASSLYLARVKRRNSSRPKGGGIANSVAARLWLEAEMSRGVPKESAVRAFMEKFGVSRSSVFAKESKKVR